MALSRGRDPPASVADYKSTPLSKQIINQLLKIPHLPDWDSLHEVLTFRSITFALSNNALFYNHILDEDTCNKFQTCPISYDHVNSRYTTDLTFYLNQIKNKSSHHHHGHIGHICALSIPHGHFVYNCYDCGLDPTCCLCEHCFNKEEHSDHNVSVHRSTGDAICDCGDESSWKLELDCKANNINANLKDSMPDLPNLLKENINILVRTLLDFVLDSNLTNLHSLPKKFQDEWKEKASNLPISNNLPNLDPDVLKDLVQGHFLDFHYLIIWNDEFHNFDEAQYFLELAASNSPSDVPFQETPYTGKSAFDMLRDKIGTSARIIDQEGFICYSRSLDESVINAKMEKLNTYSLGNKQPLHFTKMTGREYSNLIISRAIIRWFDFILKNGNLKLTDYIKEQLTDALFERANFHSTLGEPYDIFDRKVQSSPGVNVPIDSLTIIMDKDRIVNQPYNDASRLQYLFHFEIRFPKSMRKIIKKTILPLISNKTNTRLEFAKQIISLLPTYEYLNTFMDREWRLSFLETFRLQVYHDPNLGTELLELGLLEKNLDSIISIFYDGNETNTNSHNIKFKVLRTDIWEEARRMECLSRSINGLSTIMKFIHPNSTKLFLKPFIIKLVQVYTLFEESFTFIRKTDIHEEYDHDNVSNLHLGYMRMIIALSASIGNVVSSFQFLNKDLEDSIALITSYLKSKKRSIRLHDHDDEKSKIVNFDVTRDGVSMMHPLGVLLSHLLLNYDYVNPQLLLNCVSHITVDSNSNKTFQIEETPQDFPDFIGVADEMLQPLVFKDQISCNFWIRNGASVVNAAQYFDEFECVPQHFFIIQQGIILDQLSLVDIVDRYMLLDCYDGKTDFNDTIYQDKITMMLSGFVSLMYNIFTFRHIYDSTSERKDIVSTMIEYQICSLLADGPKKYSTIKAAMSEYDVDALLKIFSNFEPPSTYNDYGSYTLKPEFAHTLDPFSFCCPLPASELEEPLAKTIAIQNKKKVEDAILEPVLYDLNEVDLQKFDKIRKFMKSKNFTKFLYKILRFAVTSDNDSHLNVTLQLIHAIVLDDELKSASSSESSLKSFVEIPICNLLLNAAEKSDLPKYISKKASTILEKLLFKDDDVLTSLLDCFGAAHIDEYKKSSNGKGLETKVEKKRRLALKRQKKVMKKMMKQQSDFVNNNQKYLDGENDENGGKVDSKNANLKEEEEIEPENDHSAHNTSVSERSCIVCKNPETANSLFGIPVFYSTSSAFWTIPALGDDIPSFMVEEFNEEKSEKKHHEKSGTASCVREKIVVTGCPHGMHFECFKQMLEEKRMYQDNFSCPLCKYKFNGFIPSFKHSKFEIDASCFEQRYYSNDTIEESLMGLNIANLSDKIFDEDLSKVLLDPNHKGHKKLISEIKSMEQKSFILEKSLPLWKSNSLMFDAKVLKGAYSRFSMALIIGSTLELQEIINRKADEIKIPEILLNTLRSMLQYRVMKHYVSKNETSEQLPYYKVLIHNPNLGFMETALLFFTEGRHDLEDCIRFAWIKRFLYIGLSILERFKLDPKNLNFDSILDEVDEKIYPSRFIYKVIARHLVAIAKNRKLYDEIELINLFYRVLVTNHKIYKRQVEYICRFLNVPPHKWDELLPDVDIFVKFLNLPDPLDIFSVFLDGAKISKEEKMFPPSHKRDGSIFPIEYTRPIHLIELPTKLKDIALVGLKKKEEVVTSTGFNNRKRKRKVKCEHICLHCEAWIGNMKQHVLECSMSGYSCLIFTPVKNTITMVFSHLIGCSNRRIESPYLNKHGEPAQGLIGMGDAGTLNLERYQHLQDEWFKQNIIYDQIRTMDYFDGMIDMSENQFPGIYELPPPDGMHGGFVPPRSVMAMLNENADGNPDPALLVNMLRNHFGRMRGDFDFGESDDDDDDYEDVNEGYDDNENDNNNDEDENEEEDEEEEDRDYEEEQSSFGSYDSGFSENSDYLDGYESDYGLFVEPEDGDDDYYHHTGYENETDFNFLPHGRDDDESFTNLDAESRAAAFFNAILAPRLENYHHNADGSAADNDEDGLDGSYSDDESGGEYFIGRDVYGNYVRGRYPSYDSRDENEDEEFSDADSTELRDAYYMNFLRDTAANNPSHFQDDDSDDYDYEFVYNEHGSGPDIE